jgi:hypothetical protein
MSEKTPTWIVGCLAALMLAGCGTYQAVTLYEASTPAGAARFDPGDNCSAPDYLPLTVSNRDGATVRLSAYQIVDRVEVHSEVRIVGQSKFGFLQDVLTFHAGDNGVGTPAKMGEFALGSGSGQIVGKKVYSPDELSGPGVAGFQPYYPSDRYESADWDFDSVTLLPFPDSTSFSVQLPDAVVDGVRLSFPRVDFHRRKNGNHQFCLK